MTYLHSGTLMYCFVSVNAPVIVNVDNNGRCRSRYCKRVYNNDTVSVNFDSNGRDLTFTLRGVFTLTGATLLAILHLGAVAICCR